MKHVNPFFKQPDYSMTPKNFWNALCEFSWDAWDFIWDTFGTIIGFIIFWMGLALIPLLIATFIR